MLGQRKLLKWTVPGMAHVLAFWGFILLVLTLVESYGALFVRDFHIPIIGTEPWLGFLEDLVRGRWSSCRSVVFAVIRLVHSPRREGRRSRFFGSHLDAAWLVLFMIFNVVWSLLLYRGAQINTGNFPYQQRRVRLRVRSRGLLDPLGAPANDVIETVGHPRRDRRRPGVPRARRALQAPAHHDRRRSTSRSPAARAPSARCCRSTPAASRSTSRTPARTT